MSAIMQINDTWLGRLRAVNRRVRPVLPNVLAIIISMFAIFFVYMAYRDLTPDRYRHVDFFGIWSFSKFALVNSA